MQAEPDEAAMPFTYLQGGRWIGHYPPGWPALLAPGAIRAGGVFEPDAVAALRRAEAKKLIVAVPTGHEDAVRSMAKQVDVVCCANIRRGRSFAVASAYRHWSDISEAEAEQILLGTGDTQG